MSYCIWIVSPAGYIHSEAFREVAIGLQSGLKTLGHDAPIVTSHEDITGTPIILGATLLNKVPLHNIAQPIIYNLEQISLGSPWLTEAYINILKRHTVWDYSLHNIDVLKKMGIEAKHLPIGYAPELTKIPAMEKDIDVLLYGSLNPRRTLVINKLLTYCIKAVSAFGVYGKERDELIAKARIVLNVHYYESKIFEIVRCSYLMANKVCIVSEEGADKDVERQYEHAVAFAPYDMLVDRCRELLKFESARDMAANKGFDIFSKHLQSDYLKVIL